MVSVKYVVEMEKLPEAFGEWDRLCVPVFMRDGENSYIPCGYKHLKLLTKEDLEYIPNTEWDNDRKV